MNQYLEYLIAQFANKGLLIDTNLLLVYIVGLVDPAQLTSFNRTSKFSAQDFELLAEFAKLFRIHVTLPYVLAEVSDFIDQRRQIFGTIVRGCWQDMSRKSLKDMYLAQIL